MTSVEILAMVADPVEDGPVAQAASTVGRVVERLGLAVRQRRYVGLDEATAERALREAIDGGALVAVLGDEEGALLARRALARILGVRLVLSDRVLDAVAQGYARQDRAMPRRAEALALIAELSDFVTRPAFLYRHRWQVGDLLMWDNCCAQHCAMKDYALPQRRLMYRVTVNGTVPV